MLFANKFVGLTLSALLSVGVVGLGTPMAQAANPPATKTTPVKKNVKKSLKHGKKSMKAAKAAGKSSGKHVKHTAKTAK